MGFESAAETECEGSHMSVKDKLISFGLGAAAVLGTLIFLVWKLYAHNQELRNAERFISTAPDEMQKEILEGLQIKKEGFNEKAWAIREEVEQAKKEDIIYAFEKAFGVSTHHSYKYRDPADDGNGADG